MTLTLHAAGAYAVYDYKATKWRPGDHAIHNLVKALKREPFRGYSILRGVDGATIQFNKDNPQVADRAFGQWAAARLKGLGLDNALIVPVPASDHTVLGKPFTGARLAGLIQAAAKGSKTEAAPILAFKTVMPKAHKKEEGGRRQSLLRDGLQVGKLEKGRPVVLLDDVVTSGAHMRACADFLRERGATVEHALCAGRTVWEQVPDPFKMPAEDLEANAFGFEFESS